MKTLTTLVILSAFLAPQNIEAAARSFNYDFKKFKQEYVKEVADQAPTLELPQGCILPPIDEKSTKRFHWRFDHPNGKSEYRPIEIPYKK